MRNAINENRRVQLALLAVLVLGGGFMLMKAKGGSESTAATPAATSTAAAPTDPSATVASTPPTDPTTGLPVVASTTAVAVPASMVPGPGLPKSLLSAYRNGDAIALLVRRAGGFDDALVRNSVQLLRAVPSVDVYVTNAKHIARYTWLTQGVNVTDLPALVVLRPRKLTKGIPTASVSYGFRDAPSVLQAVEDGLYRGPTDRPYHP